MKVWFSSDYHLGHANIIKYCKRPFKNLEHMDKTKLYNISKGLKDDYSKRRSYNKKLKKEIKIRKARKRLKNELFKRLNTYRIIQPQKANNKGVGETNRVPIRSIGFRFGE